jgi:hypothetical protein
MQTGDEPVTAWFEYGPTSDLGSTIAASGDPGSPSPALYSAALSGLSPGSTVYFRARATNASGSSTGLIQSSVVPSPFDAWKLQHFGTTSVPPTEDYDQDGIPNLVEYALLSLPNAPDQADSLKPTLSSYPEGLRLSTMVRRDSARTDVTVQVQVADSVSGPWTPLATSTGGNPFSGPGYVGGDSATPGLKWVEVRDVVNVTEASLRFLRVHVSLP